MVALLRLLFAFGVRFVPFLSVAGSVLSVAWTLLSDFVSAKFSRFWYWGLMVLSFLMRYMPVLLFVSAVLLISNLLFSLVAFVLYHVNAFLALGLSPFVTLATVRVIDDAVVGVLVFHLVRLAVFLGSGVAAAVPVPQAPVTWSLWISALKK